MADGGVDLANVYLPDSWVLEVSATPSSVCFVLDAVLTEGHPSFYWPPGPGEQHAYARLRWCLVGGVYWNDGPHLDRPAVDASGETDFGHIDVWLEMDDGGQLLEGDWGSVVVAHAMHSVTYLG